MRPSLASRRRRRAPCASTGWLATRALAATRRACKLHRAAGLASIDAIDRSELWWRHCQALRACGHEDEAQEALAQAWRFVLASLASLGDEGLRRNVLNKPEVTREIVQAWIAHARQRPWAARRLREDREPGPACG